MVEEPTLVCSCKKKQFEMNRSLTLLVLWALPGSRDESTGQRKDLCTLKRRFGTSSLGRSSQSHNYRI